MKSFIPWIGGKSLLANRIISMFPEKIDRFIAIHHIIIQRNIMMRAFQQFTTNV